MNDLVANASRATLRPVGAYLDVILQAHRAREAADRRDLGTLVAQARSCPPCRGFAAALRSQPIAAMAAKREDLPARHISVIAEIKRRSPSKGLLAPDLVAGLAAKAYAAAGATCLSVLTDAEFFGGSPADLAEARAAIDLPVLRKDFTVGPADVCDARLMGADAVLLIVSALPPAQLVDLVRLAARLGIDALVEVHDEVEA
ncbi:MAG TPA: indole-3-glycerol phosphate synthase TrpC, partial [Acidimicrobiales bacterium]|nr:indole-3-glycerol phosphate synthase TrpC [Acidimicrobiales bacterium]